MVFTKEAIEQVLAVQEESSEKKVEKLLSLYNEDANAMKLNRDDLKNEKKILQDKNAELVAQNSKIAEDFAALQKQLEDSSPEAIQKAYEQKKTELESSYKGVLAERDASIKTLTEQLNLARESEHSLKCIQEFNKELASFDIEPSDMDFVMDLILGQKCSKFSERDLGNGLQLIDKDGKTIRSSLHTFFDTPTGKKFLRNSSSGGGSGTVPGGTPKYAINPFDPKTLNLTEQARLFREEPEQYKLLKAAAGV